MKEAKFLLQDLLQEAIKRNDMQPNILATFNLIKNEIVDLFKKIQLCENVNTANKYFDELQELQEVLSQLLFKCDLKLPVELINFISECDRLDDIRLREYLFNKVKNNAYSFDRLLAE